MKKQTFFLVTLLTWVSMTAFGQVNLSKDFKISTGTPYPVVDGASKEYFSDGKSQSVMVKTQGERVTIQRFDFVAMKELSRKVYEDFPEYTRVQKVLQVGEKLFYIYDTYNKKEKKESVYAREVNWSDGTFKEPKLLFTTTTEVTISSYLEGGTSIFNLVGIRFEAYSSFDNSKLLIRYRTKPVERDDAKSFDVLGFYVFDMTLTKQWGGEVKMPYTEKQMNNLAYTVSKDGTAYMLASIVESKTIELITVKPDLSVNATKLDITANLFFQEFKLRETADGNLAAIGYYANGIEFKMNWTGSGALSINVNGILQIKMTTAGKIVDKIDIEFPLELINQYESLRTKEKNDKREEGGKAGINDLKIVSLNLNPDGSTTLIGEQQYIRNEFVGTSQRTVYYYGDVIATKFDKKGTVLWQKKLPKTQVGFMGKGGLGIRYIKGKTTDYVLYLDNIKNAEISMDEVPAKHQDGKGGYLTAYQLEDATGKISKHPIVNVLDINGIEAFQFKTSRIFNATDKIFLLEIYIKGKEDTMVKLELNN